MHTPVRTCPECSRRAGSVHSFALVLVTHEQPVTAGNTRRGVARQLIVILGAGASYDCVSDRDNVRLAKPYMPPLVEGLFDDRYHQILDKYALAQAVAAEVRPKLAQGSEAALRLEDYLREKLRQSDAQHRRAQYWSVPLYLQELFLEASWQYTQYPDNFDRLVSTLLHLERVVFVTLNYDTIFDRVLGKYCRLDTMDDYMADPTKQLIKLHGSVNWGRRLPGPWDSGPPGDGYSELCNALATGADKMMAEDIELILPAKARAQATDLRSRSEGFFYPALAAPLGSDDETVCPPSHRDELVRSLDQHSYGYNLHLLIVGYSCLDRTPLDLVKNSGSRIASVVIANGSAAAGRDALQRLQQHLGGAAPYDHKESDFVHLIDGGFADLAASDELEALVERVGAAPD